MIAENEDELPLFDWDIQREGRAWTAEEFNTRVPQLMSLNFEVDNGKLFWSEKTRRMVLAMLLENVGMDAAVRMGDPALWKEAVDRLLAEKTKP